MPVPQYSLALPGAEFTAPFRMATICQTRITAPLSRIGGAFLT